jgi:hypothetical protein
MADDSRAVRLAGSAIDCRCHVCAFFDSRDQEYQVLLPFMKEGFDAGDKAFHILDRDSSCRSWTFGAPRHTEG